MYGDTDSVFVNSNVTDFAEALKISAEFKKHVNEQYKLLEIDLDGVFQRLLLLQKKKYAAIKMEDATRTSVEVKGCGLIASCRLGLPSSFVGTGSGYHAGCELQEKPKSELSSRILPPNNRL